MSEGKEKLIIKRLDGACFQGGLNGLEERALYGVFLGDDVKGFGFDTEEVMMMAHGLASHLGTEVEPYFERFVQPVHENPQADFFVPEHFMMSVKSLLIDDVSPSLPYKDAIASLHESGVDQLFEGGTLGLTKTQVEEYKAKMLQILDAFPDTAQEASALIKDVGMKLLHEDKSLDTTTREGCNEISRKIVAIIKQGAL